MKHMLWLHLLLVLLFHFLRFSEIWLKNLSTFLATSKTGIQSGFLL